MNKAGLLRGWYWVLWILVLVFLLVGSLAPQVRKEAFIEAFFSEEYFPHLVPCGSHGVSWKIAYLEVVGRRPRIFWEYFPCLGRYWVLYFLLFLERSLWIWPTRIFSSLHDYYLYFICWYKAVCSGIRGDTHDDAFKGLGGSVNWGSFNYGFYRN